MFHFKEGDRFKFIDELKNSLPVGSTLYNYQHQVFIVTRVTPNRLKFQIEELNKNHSVNKRYVKLIKTNIFLLL